jgi:hypothetical protein
MRDWLVLIAHLVVTTIRTMAPGGARAVIAESMLLKHQLLILNRSRNKAPKLQAMDRILLGLGAMLVSPQRMLKVAVAVRPATLLRFHRALVRRRYQWLFSSENRQRPGPKGPSKELIAAILEIKRLNPRFGCPRIAQQISHAFGLEIDKDVVRRILANPLPKSAAYYNQRRVHAGLNGRTPFEPCGATAFQPASLQHFAWRSDCSGLFHTPIAA